MAFENGETIKSFSPVLLKNYIKYNYFEENIDISNFRFYKAPEIMRKERIEIDTEPQPVRFL